jgi:hypothetical protein
MGADSRFCVGQKAAGAYFRDPSSPDHVGLCATEDVLIAGDMVLPRISTNVSVFAVGPKGNHLQQYLDSLNNLPNFPDYHAWCRRMGGRFVACRPALGNCTHTISRGWRKCWKPASHRNRLPISSR